jgi:hypothetical protein
VSFDSGQTRAVSPSGVRGPAIVAGDADPVEWTPPSGLVIAGAALGERSVDSPDEAFYY